MERELTRRLTGLLVGVGFFTLLLAGGQAAAATLGADVTIEVDDDASFPDSYDVVDRIEPDTVLPVQVNGFEPFARAVAEQCVGAVSQRCGNGIAVQFDALGNAEFQYLVTDAFLVSQPVAGRCRSDAAPCSLVVRAVEGDAHAEIQTVFVDPAPLPGRIRVTPSRGISPDGENVTVDVRDYPAGATVTAMLCAAPHAIGPRCGEPGPSAELVVGPDGTARTRIFIAPGRVGSERARCSRADDCGISVASDAVFARAPVVPISFAGPAGAAYETTRLALGLGFALALVAVAGWLIFRSDWSVVGEAAAPELDAADYADLDAIVAALPPEDDELAPTR